MKNTVLKLLLLLCGPIASAQDASQVIRKVIHAQALLKTVSYTLYRRDTLLTDDVRTMNGSVKIQVNRQDSLLGYKFWAKKDGETEERVFDGRAAYQVNLVAKTYTVSTSRSGILSNSYSGGGAHLLFPDLFRLDTSKVSGFQLSEDADKYYLKLSYPDYLPENVVKRSKLLSIDKKTMLPMAMRNHQEAYGKVQDLYFEVKTIRINEPEFGYNFSDLPFLKDYSHEVKKETAGSMPIVSLLNKPAPSFMLNSFGGERVSSADFKGDVVLIDLWEIWCGPCIASMPKIEALYKRYKEQGLRVYGITNDARALSAARMMVQKRGVELPMLIGNDQFRKDYALQHISLPMYILIGRNGIVRKLFPGYSDELEQEIKKALL